MKMKNKKNITISKQRFQNSDSGLSIMFSLFYFLIGFLQSLFAIGLFKGNLNKYETGPLMLMLVIIFILPSFFISKKFINLKRAISQKEKTGNFLGTNFSASLILPVAIYILGIIFCIVMVLLHPPLVE